MASSRVATIGLFGLAGVAAVYLTLDANARRKAVRWLKVVWDGDEEGKERRRQFLFVAEAVERWQKKVPKILTEEELDAVMEAKLKPPSSKLLSNRLQS